MRCNVCGRQTMNEAANFCDYCGSSLREQNTSSNDSPQFGQGSSFPQNEPASEIIHNQNDWIPQAAEREQPEKPVSFLDWLGTYGIRFIPVVGWLIFLIMLFIWAFSKDTPQSKKNWARVKLIYTGIALVVIIIFLVIFLNFYIPVYMDIYQQMMDGTFDFNSYYNELYHQTY